MAAVSVAPGLPSGQMPSKEALSTLPDPRTPVISPQISRSNSMSAPHPELSNEVAMLSNKLIHAINHQTDLDDTLNQTRHDLETSRERVRQLEHAVREHSSLIASGVLVNASDVEAEKLRLRVSLVEERKQRAQVDNEKKSIEQELESLTTALFEEANQMVSAARKDARKDRDVVEKRNEQLQAQLNDAELLLASHQEQLAELKTAMQDMSTQRNDCETITTTSTAPSTPALDTNENMSKIFDALHLSPTIPGGDEVPPAPPTSFTHLLSPILRTDVQAYEDFSALMELSRRSSPPSRVVSGSYSGLTGLGLSNVTKGEQSQISGRIPSNGSTSSLTGSNNCHSTPSTPTLPASTSTSTSSREIPISTTPLKETSFYKRVLTEDIEPTLRLDSAPGLSWLARRGVINSMCEGRLVVEPTPPSARPYDPPCALCGEQGLGQKRARTHRFRTNESESAQRYPLCEYCLNRVRSSCEFLGFLRMIKDGHRRIDGPHAEATAWEESVRLRERMFWSRIGGGVIPAFLRARSDSPRSSVEDNKLGPVSSKPQKESMSPSSRPDVPSPLSHESGQGRRPSHIDEITTASKCCDQGDARPVRPLTQSQAIANNVRTPSSESREASQTQNQPLPSRTIMQSRSTGVSDGTSKISIARRAAMFEKVHDAQAAANQLQSSLQASIRTSSPSKDLPIPPIAGAFRSTSSHDRIRTHKQSGSIPGAFDP